LFLKRLDIQGFKSFADRTTLEFVPGITCIVGPNGCGKSNIVDAIRWVLGEQGAKPLRGFRMEDVIFAGSERRRPLGMAEVAITVDNNMNLLPLEFSEVSIARRLFRSGESDYLINKNSCRLRDIHELFLDTGVGKDAFSIVGQGQVDAVLSSKPEDRRQLIEEAAGVVRYRHRKREAVRKLEETERNLQRLADILGELSAQLAPLSEQAETAARYLQLKGELDKLEVGLILHEIDWLNGKVADLRQTMDRLVTKSQNRESELNLTAANLEDRESRLKSLGGEIARLQQEIYELTREVERQHSRGELARQKIQSLQDRRLKLEEECQTWQAKLESLVREYSTEETGVAELAGAVQNGQFAVLASEQELSDLEAEIGGTNQESENLKAALIDLLNRIAANNNLLSSNRTSMELAKQRLMGLTDSTDLLRGQRAALAKEEDSLAADMETFGRKLERLALERESAENNLEKLERQLVSHRQRVRSFEDKLHVLGSRHEALQELNAGYDGYNQGVRFVMQAVRGGDPVMAGIQGVVSDLISVPPRFEEAIEAALGGAIQHIVTETDQDAKRVINFLREGGYGRATFLPLNTVRPSRKRDDLARAVGFPGFLGEADQVVDFPPELRRVIQYLLGGVLVSEDIDAAVLLARRLEFQVKVVTLGGDLISPGGALTGGKFNRKVSFLGRKRELESLAGQIKDVRSALDRLGQEEKQIEELLEAARGQQAGLHKEYQEGQIIYSGLTKDLEQKRAEIIRVEQQTELLGMEADKVSEEVDRASRSGTGLSSELAQLKNENSRLEDDLNQNQQRLRALEHRKSELLQLLTESKVALATVRQHHQDRVQGLERYYQTRIAYEQEVTGRQAELQVIGQTAAELEANIKCLEAEAVGFGDRLAALEAELAEARTGHGSVRDAVEGLTAELNAGRQELTNLAGRVHAVEVQLVRLEAEADGARRMLADKFGLEHGSAADMPRSSDPKADRELIETFKADIEGLGAVNTLAIAEHEKVKERHQFLSGQCQDLEEAKESLYRVIKEMDAIMRQQFEETFKTVQANFSVTFQELFGGGRAELALTGPDDILEAGIDIVVQPPGKKLQHLSLLSGGEKTLTAVALLFAILRTRPSPLCILDEIESALDEANVARFAAFLKLYARNTQFVLISHRKGTMEVADVLYGVTMEETGVSKLVSVRLEEAMEKVS